jgi:hypothetical protein
MENSNQYGYRWVCRYFYYIAACAVNIIWFRFKMNSFTFSDKTVIKQEHDVSSFVTFHGMNLLNFICCAAMDLKYTWHLSRYGL